MDLKPNQRQQIDQPLRTKAKTQFARATEPSESSESCFTQNIDELLHKLRVHQIELEMQNEELRCACTELAIFRDRYMQFYDFASAEYCHSIEIGITEANLACIGLLGIERSRPDQPNYILLEDIDRWYPHFMHAKQYCGKHDCEFTLHHTNGTDFGIHLNCLNTVTVASGTKPALLIACFPPGDRTLPNSTAALNIIAALETTMDIIVTKAHKIILSVNQAEKVLIDAHQRMENQVATSQKELSQIKDESAAVNVALNVLLKHQQTDKSDAQNMLSQEFDSSVLPFLRKLRQKNSNRQQTRLIDILENNLQEMVKSYGSANKLAAAYRQLSPVEVRVASMVKQGLSTKLIAMTLNISPGTVGIHRKHIRKKLGLDSKATNLHGYLLSLGVVE